MRVANTVVPKLFTRAGMSHARSLCSKTNGIVQDQRSAASVWCQRRASAASVGINPIITKCDTHQFRGTARSDAKQLS